MIKSKDMFLYEQERMAANSGNGNSLFTNEKQKMEANTGSVYEVFDEKNNIPMYNLNNKQVLEMSLLPYLKLDKSKIKDIVDNIVLSVSEGIEDDFDMLIMARKGIALFTAIEDNVKDYVYGKQYEKHSRHGCDIEPAQLGTKFDYSVCNDSVLIELEQKAKLANEAVKDRQNFLKAINGSATLVDTETGETYTAYPPTKTATSGYKVIIK